MPTLIDKEIERAIEQRLSAPAAAKRPAGPIPRSRPPQVRFSPLFVEASPNASRRKRLLVGWSIAVHVLLVVGVVLMPKKAQTVEDPSLPIQITFAVPAPPVPEMSRPPLPPKPAPQPKAKPEPPKPEPPPAAAEPKPVPKPQPREPEPLPAPIVKAQPPKPKPEVKTGLLDDAPSGPAIVSSRTSKSVVVASGFEGAAGSPSTPARPGRVIEAAFDTAPAPARTSRVAAGTIRETGFGEEVAAVAPKKREREKPAGALDSEVEILSKPKPVYTDEARALKLEGDVVLDVRFEASGKVVVLGVASGLGHGLDEAAATAARKIQFNPARRDGSPVDHTAKLRVVFRLA
jgi:TonB family protein